jgi:NAD(P)-dependent dehydrogenase (short-subunit alcohol dehydrogenase family)
MGGVSGKAAVITGGAGVIGGALARHLVGAGARVTLADLDAGRGEALAAELGCSFVETDVRDPGANEEMIAAAVDHHGRLDLVFLNAGVSLQSLKASLPYDPAGIDLEAYRQILSVNIDGGVFGVSAAIPALVRSGGGAIVITASVAGLIAWPPDPVYTISKHGLVGYVRSLAPGLKEQGITINAVCPGATGRFDPGRIPDGLAVLAPEALAAAMLEIATDSGTGRAASVVADREPVVQFHEFGEVEGF